jgi:ABC-2 type transport system permease protein
VNVDATAITQAGNGTIYIESIIYSEVANFLARREGGLDVPVKVVVRAKFNPNLKSSWFASVMQVINNLTLLTVILTGAALIRERVKAQSSISSSCLLSRSKSCCQRF